MKLPPTEPISPSSHSASNTTIRVSNMVGFPPLRTLQRPARTQSTYPQATGRGVAASASFPVGQLHRPRSTHAVKSQLVGRTMAPRTSSYPGAGLQRESNSILLAGATESAEAIVGSPVHGQRRLLDEHHHFAELGFGKSHDRVTRAVVEG